MPEVPPTNTPNEQVINLFSQVDQQLAKGQPATVLVGRSNGDITTAQVAGITENRTKAFFGNIAETPLEYLSHKPVDNERLTDEYQGRLAASLAGAAFRSGGVDTVTESKYGHLFAPVDLEPVAEQQPAQPPADEEMIRVRTQADTKYSQVRQLGGSHEEAEAAAGRVWKHYGF